MVEDRFVGNSAVPGRRGASVPRVWLVVAGDKTGTQQYGTSVLDADQMAETIARKRVTDPTCDVQTQPLARSPRWSGQVEIVASRVNYN